jgi:hypothetical protein
MDVSTALNSLGIGGGVGVGILAVYYFIRRCLKVKCVEDQQGHMHLDISLKVSEEQRKLIEQNDEMKQMLQTINQYLISQSRRNISEEVKIST